MKEAGTIPCTIIRGGTTKGVFIELNDLPSDPEKRDKLILSLFGSPDHRQINGIGGADPLTSKVVLVNRSNNGDTDIDYLSGEVSIDSESINFKPPCGNLAPAAAMYALTHGYMDITEPVTRVRILNRNSDKHLVVDIPVSDGQPILEASDGVDGVPGFGTNLQLTFNNPSGALTGELFPAGGNALTLSSNGQDFRASIIDCGTLYCIFDYTQFPVSLEDQPTDLDQNSEFKSTIEDLRETVARIVSEHTGKPFEPGQVKIALVKYSRILEQDDAYDLFVETEAIVVNKFKTHKAYPVTGAIALSGLLLLTENFGFKSQHSVKKGISKVKIIHPSGELEILINLSGKTSNMKLEAASVKRSARILMTGVGYYCFGR